jgi:hypothetical protein
MLLIRSGSTLVPLLPSGSRYWPSPASPSGISFSGGGASAPGARGRVGRQSTNFSPISDCGRIWQLASARKSRKPGSVMSMTMIALPGFSTGLPFLS